MMRRWFHDRFDRHRWAEITHRHEVEIDGENGCYRLAECPCGVIRESFCVSTVLPLPVPGMVAVATHTSVKSLARMEDARVWSA